jgi:hypothetical protein
MLGGEVADYWIDSISTTTTMKSCYVPADLPVTVGRIVLLVALLLLTIQPTTCTGSRFGRARIAVSTDFTDEKKISRFLI